MLLDAESDAVDPCHGRREVGRHGESLCGQGDRVTRLQVVRVAGCEVVETVKLMTFGCQGAFEVKVYQRFDSDRGFSPAGCCSRAWILGSGLAERDLCAFRAFRSLRVRIDPEERRRFDRDRRGGHRFGVAASCGYYGGNRQCEGGRDAARRTAYKYSTHNISFIIKC